MKFNYRFYANVETPLRLSGWTYDRTLTLPLHGDIILNSMRQTREEWNSHVLSRADF